MDPRTHPIYGCTSSDVVARRDLEPLLGLRTRIMALCWFDPDGGVSHDVRVDTVMGDPESAP